MSWSSAHKSSDIDLRTICVCRLFEPYIVQLMGKLLERFGDPSSAVRLATDGVARAVMANLSSQGALSRLVLLKRADAPALPLNIILVSPGQGWNVTFAGCKMLMMEEKLQV